MPLHICYWSNMYASVTILRALSSTTVGSRAFPIAGAKVWNSLVLTRKTWSLTVFQFFNSGYRYHYSLLHFHLSHMAYIAVHHLYYHRIFTITACIFSYSLSISFWTQDFALQQILSSIDLFLSYRTDYRTRTVGPSNDLLSLMAGFVVC